MIDVPGNIDYNPASATAQGGGAQGGGAHMQDDTENNMPTLAKTIEDLMLGSDALWFVRWTLNIPLPGTA